MTCNECEELLPLYAAGALAPADAERVRAHLASGCASCAAALAEYEQALSHLPLGLVPTPPSDAARRTLMQRVRDSKRATTKSTPVAVELKPTEARKQSRWTYGFWPYVISTVVLLAIGATVFEGVWVYETGIKNDDLQAQIEKQQGELQQKDVALSSLREIAKSNQLKLASFKATDPKSQARGRLFWDEQHHRWHVYVFNMTPPGKGKVLELWYITPDQRKFPAGTFNVDEDGNGKIIADLPADVADIQLAAITDEPMGGSQQPTGTIQLVSEVGTK